MLKSLTLVQVSMSHSLRHVSES